jgi:hypothetical protein
MGYNSVKAFLHAEKKESGTARAQALREEIAQQKV